MELSKKYQPEHIEKKWYQYWLDRHFFASSPQTSKTPYTILIPPPNVTGVLHMGHMLNNTIQDILIRKARMEGKEALWVPGTDHASIATEAKVVNMLKNEYNLKKEDIGRKKFLEHAWIWKEKYGGVILEQLKKLGASCDWDRTRFTMEKDLSQSVIKTFIRLHEKGYIYKGSRMINWDPEGKTAIADDEVIHQERQSKLYYIAYPFTDGNGKITIATTRPETIFADSAIAVHPHDTRYKHLLGKKVFIPLLNKAIPVLADDYITMEFGTGALKVTPAHDINDYELGKKHNLPCIDILDESGKLNQEAQLYIGKDRFVARKEIAKELKEKGYLIKIENHTHNIGLSERTNAVIEPKLSKQWFVKMEKLVSPALKAVENGTIKFYPDKFKNTYFQWMNNVRDWCISRQLWWGHQIPVYYLPSGAYVVAENETQALKKAQSQNPDIQAKDLKQDPDVLDTWFSSGLWPLSVFDGIISPENKDINYYYPTNDIVTAPEILFFWIARMIIFGYEYLGEAPFKNVYLTGIVRDKKRRKMSKQLGNSPDPIELMKKYGADGVRVGMLFSSPAGNDLLFDEKLCQQGRNFSNKIWNAFRLIQSWIPEEKHQTPLENQLACQWFETKINDILDLSANLYKKYKISDILIHVYRLIWDSFCSWFLESIKPNASKTIDLKTHEQTIIFLETLLKILHPFMPFITEELWHLIKKRQENESIMISLYPQIKRSDEHKTIDNKQLEDFDMAFSLVSFLRNIKIKNQLSPKIPLKIILKTQKSSIYERLKPLIIKLANLESLTFSQIKPDDTYSYFIHKSDEVFIPIKKNENTADEKKKRQKELIHTEKFLASIEKKLNNPTFLNNAPEAVIVRERKKAEDAQNKLEILKNRV